MGKGSWRLELVMAVFSAEFAIVGIVCGEGWRRAGYLPNLHRF